MTLEFGVFVPQGWRMDLTAIADPIAATAKGREAHTGLDYETFSSRVAPALTIWGSANFAGIERIHGLGVNRRGEGSPHVVARQDGGGDPLANPREVASHGGETARGLRIRSWADDRG